MSLITLIAQRLRVLRVRHGFTQEEAAQLCGMDLKFYQALESGRKKQLWLETVERLAKPYGLTAAEMIGPELPAHSSVSSTVAESSIHYRAHRRGPRALKPPVA